MLDIVNHIVIVIQIYKDPENKVPQILCLLTRNVVQVYMIEWKHKSVFFLFFTIFPNLKFSERG